MNDRFQTFAASLAVIVSAVALAFSAQTSFVPVLIVGVMFFHLVWGLTLPTKPHTVVSFLLAIPFALWFKFYPASLPGYGGPHNIMRLLPILGFYILFLDVHQILCHRRGGNLDLSLGTAVFAFALAGAAQTNPFFLPLACILIGVVLWELRRNLQFKTPLGSSQRRYPLSQAFSFIAVIMVAVGLQILLVDQLPTLSSWLVNNVANASNVGSVAAGFSKARTAQIGSVSDLWDQSHDDAIVLRCWSSEPPEYLRGSVFVHYDHNTWRSVQEEKVTVPTSDHHGRHVFQFSPHVSEKVLGSIYPEREFSNTFFLPVNTHQIATFESEVRISPAWTAVPAGSSLATRGGYEYYKSIDKMAGPAESDRYVPGNMRREIHEVANEVFGAAATEHEKMVRLKDYFNNNFRYKLGITIPEGKDSVLEFLQVIRAGHCEYFASAGVLLLRSAGIPARYVTGFRCDERGLTGDFWVSRQRDAHAWVEAYVRNEGWVTFDPTPGNFRPERTTRSIARETSEWLGSAFSTFAQFFIYGGIGGILSAGWEMLVNVLLAIPQTTWPLLVAIGVIVFFRDQIRQFFGGGASGPAVTQRARQLQRKLTKIQRSLKRHGLIQPPHVTVHDFIQAVRQSSVPEPLKSQAIEALTEYNDARFVPEDRAIQEPSAPILAAPSRALQTSGRID